MGIKKFAVSLSRAYRTNEKARRIIFIGVIAVMFLLMFFLTKAYPFLADDVDYSYVYWTDRPLASLGDVFESVGRYYVNWGGRIFMTFVTQMNALLGKAFFSFSNAFIYCLFILLVYKLTSRSMKYDVMLLILINLGIWAFNPSWEESMLWLTGSSYYMWYMLFPLAALIPYKKYLLGEKVTYGPLGVAGMFAVSLISGNSLENMAAGLIAMAVGALILAYVREKKFNVLFAASLIGTVSGFALNYFSPGLANRIAITAEHAQPSSVSGIYTYISRFNNITICFIDFMLPLIIGFVLLFIFYAHYEKDKNVMLASGAFALLALACAYSMVISPSFPYRAWLPSLLALVIASGLLLGSIKKNADFIAKLSFALIVLAALPFALSVRNMFLYIQSDNVGLSITGSLPQIRDMLIAVINRLPYKV